MANYETNWCQRIPGGWGQSPQETKMKTVASIPILIISCLQLLVAQSTGGPGHEQTHFSAEDGSVTHPIVLPGAALRLIKEDPSVAEALKSQAPATTQVPGGWLMASDVHLAGTGENDIVVVAAGLLRGANVTTFWVLRPADRGYELLLTAPAHDLVIKRTRSKGYKDIELLSATAVEVSTVSLRFDGRWYQVHARSSKPIR
jgi:hypothetical protein